MNQAEKRDAQSMMSMMVVFKQSVLQPLGVSTSKCWIGFSLRVRQIIFKITVVRDTGSSRAVQTYLKNHGNADSWQGCSSNYKTCQSGSTFWPRPLNSHDVFTKRDRNVLLERERQKLQPSNMVGVHFSSVQHGGTNCVCRTRTSCS